MASDVAINLNELGALMEDIVMRNIDSTTIIIIKRSGSRLWRIHIDQEPSKLDKLTSGVNKSTILNLSIGMRNHILLLATPWDKRSTQHETKTYDGALIRWITYPIRIWISMELERRPRGVVKTIMKCALDVSKNPNNNNLMDRTKGVHELTNHTHDMWNIWASNCEIDQTTNQLTIMSSI